MTDLDQFLREDGAAWRSQVDKRRPDDVVAAPSSHHRNGAHARTWRMSLLAAASVGVIAAGISLIATYVGGSGNPDSGLPVLPTAGTRADPLAPSAPFLVTYAQRHAQTLALIGPNPAAGHVVSQRWSFVKLLDAGRTILVSYQLGGLCEHELGFHVQQGRNAVELASLTENRSGSCSQSAPVGYGIVRLSQPLAGRILLHAPVSNEARNEVNWQLSPWALVPIHPTDDPTVMLIEVTQDTRDTHSVCWEESRTTTSFADDKFEITLWVGQRSQHRRGQGTFQCTANSVAGPFYATVHLPQPYDGQALVDPLSGRNHQPAEPVHLSDVPRKYR